MIIVFALFGVIFSILKLIAQPFAHNYNRAFIIFSLSTWLEEPILQLSVALYAGCYNVILSFLAVQFVFRLLSICDFELTKKFKGIGVLGWILYPIVSGGLYSWALYLFALPDEYSEEYLRGEILEVYAMDISAVAHFSLVPYAADNSLRWNNLLFILTGSSLLGFQYLIIIFCGFRMHFCMNKELEHLSVPNRKLQKQFFKALIVQTLVPTFLFVFPAFPLIIGPLMDLKWSMQTGVVIALLSIYPPIDSIAFMLIVTEYRKFIKGLCGFSNMPSQPISCVTI